MFLRQFLCFWVLISFVGTSVILPTPSHADQSLDLPAPGTMVNLTPAYQPVIIRGLTVHKDNPFLFDFIVDAGQDRLSGQPLKAEGEKLIKYFLASLAIPDHDVWVNLSPYEKDRMIPQALGQTDMGRDLLEQDYILKQLTASLIYPEKDLGKKFWDRVYAKAQAEYGTTQIPVNTFNKVWIMADRAEVFEHNQTVFVVDSHLKVMLEEDYLALSHHVIPAKAGIQNTTHSISSQIIRQIVLPELEKEVNEGKNFANLRQIFNSIILANWYKNNLKTAVLNQVYANKAKVKGIERPGVIASGAKQSQQDLSPEQIYEQYLKAYKKGVFNYIKEDIVNGQYLPRKYFSGGILAEGAAGHAAQVSEPVFAAKARDWYDPLVDISAVTMTHQPQPASAAMNAHTITVSAAHIEDKFGKIDRIVEFIQNNERQYFLVERENGYTLHIASLTPTNQEGANSIFQGDFIAEIYLGPDNLIAQKLFDLVVKQEGWKKYQGDIPAQITAAVHDLMPAAEKAVNEEMEVKVRTEIYPALAQLPDELFQLDTPGEKVAPLKPSERLLNYMSFHNTQRGSVSPMYELNRGVGNPMVDQVDAILGPYAMKNGDIMALHRILRIFEKIDREAELPVLLRLIETKFDDTIYPQLVFLSEQKDIPDNLRSPGRLLRYYLALNKLYEDEKSEEFERQRNSVYQDVDFMIHSIGIPLSEMRSPELAKVLEDKMKYYPDPIEDLQYAQHQAEDNKPVVIEGKPYHKRVLLNMVSGLKDYIVERTGIKKLTIKGGFKSGLVILRGNQKNEAWMNVVTVIFNSLLKHDGIEFEVWPENNQYSNLIVRYNEEKPFTFNTLSNLRRLKIDLLAWLNQLYVLYSPSILKPRQKDGRLVQPFAVQSRVIAAQHPDFDFKDSLASAFTAHYFVEVARIRRYHYFNGAVEPALLNKLISADNISNEDRQARADFFRAQGVTTQVFIFNTHGEDISAQLAKQPSFQAFHLFVYRDGSAGLYAVPQDAAMTAQKIGRVAGGNGAWVEICPKSGDVAKRIARRMADVLKLNNSKGKNTLFILPTGNTAIPIHDAFARIVNAEGIDCTHLMTANMDEYGGAQKYRDFMRINLFNKIKSRGFKEDDGHVLFFNGHAIDPAAELLRYDRVLEEMKAKAGGVIDLEVGGIGVKAHVAFNEAPKAVGPDTDFRTLQENPPFDWWEKNEFELKGPADGMLDQMQEILDLRQRGRRGLDRFLYREFSKTMADVSRSAVYNLSLRLKSQVVTFRVRDLARNKIPEVRLQALARAFGHDVKVVDADEIKNVKVRRVELSISTIIANAGDFREELQNPNEGENISTWAYTIGMGTVTSPKEILIAATGPKKAEAIRAATQKGVDSEVPASELSNNPNARFMVDGPAAALLDTKGFQSNVSVGDAAMTADKAAIANVIEPKLKGGIDLRTSNGMLWQDRKDGQGVEMNVDPAMIARVEKDGVDYLAPKVLRMTTVTSVWALMGIKAPMVN